MRAVNLRVRVGVGAVLTALALSACSTDPPEAPPVPDPVTCDEPVDAGAPGEAEVVLTYGQTMSGWGLFGGAYLVIYADGATAVWEETEAASFPPAGRMMTPYSPETPGAFRAGAMNPCATEQFLDRLTEVFDEPEREFGEPTVADAGSLPVQYRAPGSDEVISYSIFAPSVATDSNGNPVDGVTNEQLQARYDVFALRDFLDVNIEEGELLRPEQLQVQPLPGGGDQVPQVPPEWPIQDFEEIAVSDDCGVLSGEDTEGVLEVILAGQNASEDYSVMAVPPGISPCGG